MRQYWFEIVRRPYDRYSWVFVEVRNGRCRVLARSGRDYRSKKKVRSAIYTLTQAVVGAEVLDATGETDPFDLPTSTFEIAPFALPLVVGHSPAEGTIADGRRRMAGNRWTGAERPRRHAAKDRVLTQVPVAAGRRRGSADDDVTSTPEAPAGASARRAGRGATKRGAAAASAKRAGRGATKKAGSGSGAASDETI